MSFGTLIIEILKRRTPSKKRLGRLEVCPDISILGYYSELVCNHVQSYRITVLPRALQRIHTEHRAEENIRQRLVFQFSRDCWEVVSMVVKMSPPFSP